MSADGDNLDDLLNESTETEDAPADPVFSDSHLAELLATGVFAGKFRHATGLGWLQWDGTRWCESADKDARELARAWVAGLFDAAADAWKLSVAGRRDTGQAEAIMRGWKSYLAKTRLDAVVSLASGIHGVSTSPAEFDAHPDLLNTQSGVVDLRTGELREHDPKLLLTKVTRAAYVPGATHRDWDQAMEAVPEDVRDWYQVRLGQAITGHMTPDDVMLIQQGGGENGKSTLMGAVEQVMGDYYLTVPHRALLADSRAHSTELTEFRGSRIAVLEELPEERYLNVTQLKMLVGTPMMTARKIAQDSIKWPASHSLITNTNYEPNVNETDHGTWRRLVLVKFPYRFVGEDDGLRHSNDRAGDEGLRQRLRSASGSQGEAVLAWLVAGAVKCYASDGTQEMPSLPTRVIKDTRAWRAESDLMFAYLSEELAADAGSYVLAEDLYEDIREWLQRRNHKPWADKTIVSRIEHHDIARELAMTKERIRPRPGRSYRTDGWADEASTTPGRFFAWVGVKFADQQESGSGQGGQAHAGGPKKSSSRREAGVTLSTLPSRPRRTVTGPRSRRSTGGA